MWPIASRGGVFRDALWPTLTLAEVVEATLRERQRCHVEDLGVDVHFRWDRVKFPFSNFHSDPRLKMSGIEYVVLAGSSLFTWSGAQSRYGSGLASCWRHKERD